MDPEITQHIREVLGDRAANYFNELDSKLEMVFDWHENTQNSLNAMQASIASLKEIISEISIGPVADNSILEEKVSIMSVDIANLQNTVTKLSKEFETFTEEL